MSCLKVSLNCALVMGLSSGTIVFG